MLALAGLLALSPASNAAFTSCAYDAALHDVHAISDVASGSFLRVGPGGEILADGAVCVSAANEAATILNTDTIAIGATGDGAAVGIDLSGGPFSPGFTDEPLSTSDEIEFVLLLPGDSLPAVLGSDGPDHLVVGTAGINLNADEPDDDVNVTIGPGTPTVTLGGGGANDVLTSAGGAGTGLSYAAVTLLDGGDGTDTIVGGDSRDVEFGGPETDELDGGGGTDSLFGGNGFDILTGGAGDDQLDGGADDDWANYESAPAGVVAALPGGTAPAGDGYGTTDTYTSIERLEGSAFADVLTGDAGPNIVFAGNGSDSVSGGDGDDAIRGWNGDDVIDGGAGMDRISGDAGNDTLTGGSENDEISDGPGLDKVEGQDGNDRLDATGWDPDLGFGLGPSGKDFLSGGAGLDTVSYSLRPAPLVITLDGLANDGQPGEGDLVGPGGDVENVEGGQANGLIVGNAGPNALDGLRGNDVLLGLGDKDTLTGNLGADIAQGGAGDDLLLLDDGRRDLGIGGPGNDTADSDALDILALVESVL